MTSDAGDVVAAIEAMYAAMGENDRARLADALSEDFHAFESGVPMSGQTLLDLMGKWYAEGWRYRWSVTEPQVEVQGDLAAAVYVNVGSVAAQPGAAPMPVTWLETALLRRQSGQWRVAFLHSTRKAQVEG